MPFHFEFDRKHRILRVSMAGTLDDAGIDEFRAEIAKLLREVQPKACIVDLSAVQKYHASPEHVRAIGRAAPGVPNVFIPVIAIAPSPHLFGMSRMFQLTSDETRPWFRVVKSADEACKILEVVSLSFDPLPSNPEELKKMRNDPDPSQ